MGRCDDLDTYCRPRQSRYVRWWVSACSRASSACS
jgi:hypothetical protein